VNRRDFPPGLADHFRKHNRQATLLALGCLLGSALSWTVVYGVILWAELLYLSATWGVNAPPHITVTGHFAVAVAVLFLISRIVKMWEKRQDRFHLGRAILSLLTIPPRLTTAVWKNFSARVSPTRQELFAAWDLLEILRTEKKIAQTNLPALLQSAKEAGRVAYLLAITGLIDTDEYGGAYYYHLRNPEAERLVRRWSKSLLLED
jgi:hypothetical protein